MAGLGTFNELESAPLIPLIRSPSCAGGGVTSILEWAEEESTGILRVRPGASGTPKEILESRRLMVGDGEWMRRDREGCQFGREPFYARAERTWESRTSPQCGHGDMKGGI